MRKQRGNPGIYQFKLEHFTIPVLGNQEPGAGKWEMGNQKWETRNGKRETGCWRCVASAPHPGAGSALHQETGSEAPEHWALQRRYSTSDRC